MRREPIIDARWHVITRAFREGGYVTVYECDQYLRLARGTTRQAVQDGRLECKQQPRGTRTRILVRATDAEKVLGIVAKVTA